MLLNKHSFLFVFILLLSGTFCLSCVDIPSNAPTPPVLNSEVRFISLNPSSVSTPKQLQIADGPNFTTYVSFTVGANGIASPFTIFPAGAKKIIYRFGTLPPDADTLSVNFETDQKATLVFARNTKPDSLTKGKFSPYKLSLGYSFNPTRLQDTTMVRFVNLMVGGLDTVQIRDGLSGAIVSGGRTIVGGTSSFVKIPINSARTFYFTGHLMKEYIKLDTTVVAYKDSLKITGSSYKVQTVFIYDKYDTAAVSNANVKIKVLDEN